MYKGHRTLIKFLLLKLHTLDSLINMALYRWQSRVHVSVPKGHRTLIKFFIVRVTYSEFT